MVEVEQFECYLKKGYEIIVDRNVDRFSGFLFARPDKKLEDDLHEFDGTFFLDLFPKIRNEIERWGFYLHILYCAETHTICARIQKLGVQGFYLNENENEVVLESRKEGNALFSSLIELEQCVFNKKQEKFKVKEREIKK